MNLLNQTTHRCTHTRSPAAAVGRQRGQTLVMFLVLAGILCLGAILMFDTGQTVNKKVRLIHAADAAAYSVAAQEARVLNLAVYLNRAQVANEVTISQVVSFWSWMNMLHTHTVYGYNFFTYLAGVAAASVILSPAAPALEAIARLYKAAERVVGYGRKAYYEIATVGGLIPGARGGLVDLLSTLNHAYSAAAKAMVDYIGGADGFLIAADVVEKNDPTAKFGIAGRLLLIDQLLHATTHPVPSLQGPPLLVDYSANGVDDTGMDRFRNVVMASRDKFSAQRGLNLGPSFGPVSIKIGAWGGTDLVDYERWAALDTMFFEISFLGAGWDLPFGWGGAQAVERKPPLPPFLPGIQSGENGGPGWYSFEHGREYQPYGGSRGNSASLANSYPSVNTPWLWGASQRQLNQKTDAYFVGYQGLQPYMEVNEIEPGVRFADTPSGEAAGPMFTVYIYSDRVDARTSEDLDIGAPAGGDLELENDMADERITAISTAQTYFNRPPDYGLFQRLVPRSWNGTPETDEHLEKGSMFSPYWQPRLVETPTRLYLLAGASQLLGVP